MTYSRIIALIACSALIGVAGCHRGAGSVSAPSAHDVTEFDNAVRDGDTDIVTRLIEAKPGMTNARDENGKSPLTIATEKGDKDMADVLRQHGGHE